MKDGLCVEAPSYLDAFRGRRVLVTGHTGFKGSWLSLWLTSLGADVCGYSNTVPTTPSLFEAADLTSRLRHEVGDIRDFERLARLVAEFKPDYLFHLAAQAIVSTSYDDPVETVSTNVLGTACVLQSVRRLDTSCVVLSITSDKCYENVEQPWGYREIDALGGKDVYSGSKGAAEIITHSFQRSFFARPDSPIRVASARAGNVLGGGDWAKDRIVADCMRAWSSGQRVVLRRPSSTRPWQHVLEPLSGYLKLAATLAADASLNGESFNFGPRAEQNHSVLELLRDLAGVWGFESAGQAYEILPEPPFPEAGLLKLNCDKALARLAWSATLTYAECVEMTGAWYREVLKGGRYAEDVTREQIDFYERLARKRSLLSNSVAP